MTALPPRIDTPRLVLRPWSAADAPALCQVVLDDGETVRRWMSWATAESHADLSAVAARLDRFGAAFAAGEDWAYAVESRDDGRLLGAVGAHARPARDAIELGYWIRDSAAGRGFASEAVAAVADAAAAAWRGRRIEIRCDVRNVRSAAVARRAGFRHVETRRADATTPEGTPRDTMVWERARPSPHVTIS